MTEGNVNKCVRADAILLALSKINNVHIIALLEGLSQNFRERVLSRVMYYVIWYGHEIWRYEVDTEEWSRVLIRNKEDLMRENIDWCFNWDSRICYMPNGSLMIMGGVSKLTRT
jgi:hypothetical protein